MSKKLLIISCSKLNSDPRVLRQINQFGTKYDLYTCGLSSSQSKFEIEYFEFNLRYWEFYKRFNFLLGCLYKYFYAIPLYQIKKFKVFERLKMFESIYWIFPMKVLRDSLLGIQPDLIIANDIMSLPLAISIKKKTGCFVIFDAHEYSPMEMDEDPQWMRWQNPFIVYLCKSYIPLADRATTVAPTIALEYEKLTNKKFTIVYNAPDFQDIQPKFKQSGVIDVVHHGAAIRSRKLEVIIDAFAMLSNKFRLHLILVKTELDYFDELNNLAKNKDNIIFYDPVPTSEIPRYINQFDIGLSYIPPTNFNYKYCLPNKFFEFIQARLMIVSGPSPEMSLLIKEYQLGLVTKNFDASDIAEVLVKVDHGVINAYKQNSHKSALILSSYESMNALQIIVDDLFKSSN